MGAGGIMKQRNAGEIVTLEEFEEWCRNGKRKGVDVDAKTIYHAIQSRFWECPVCKKEGHMHRISHSLDATIDVGNPICPEGHAMVLLDKGEEDEQSL